MTGKTIGLTGALYDYYAAHAYREREILQLGSDGLTNKAIATRRRVSRRTRRRRAWSTKWVTTGT